MKERLGIEGEIRGLLEEIVGDPRSSVRLTPRRALREWFDGGEAVRARSVDGTKAERHLIAAHREALAATLLEAAKIAYWKAPVLSLRPVGPDGALYDERTAEGRWRAPARRRAELAGEAGSEIELLRACLTEVHADQGHALAQASLSLIPSDAARYYVTRTLPWDRPRTAISLLQKLAQTATRDLRVDALSSLAGRLCAIDRIHEARDTYQSAARSSPESPLDRFFLFNLSCFLGEEKAAASAAAELDALVDEADLRTKEAVALCSKWWTSRSDSERALALRVSVRLGGTVSRAAEALCKAFSP